MDLNLLMLFLEIVNAGSISQAAARLATPKATLSRKLRQLEQQVGRGVAETRPASARSHRDRPGAAAALPAHRSGSRGRERRRIGDAVAAARHHAHLHSVRAREHLDQPGAGALRARISGRAAHDSRHEQLGGRERRSVRRGHLHRPRAQRAFAGAAAGGAAARRIRQPELLRAQRRSAAAAGPDEPRLHRARKPAPGRLWTFEDAGQQPLGDCHAAHDGERYHRSARDGRCRAWLWHPDACRVRSGGAGEALVRVLADWQIPPVYVSATFLERRHMPHAHPCVHRHARAGRSDAHADASSVDRAFHFAASPVPFARLRCARPLPARMRRTPKRAIEDVMTVGVQFRAHHARRACTRSGSSAGKRRRRPCIRKRARTGCSSSATSAVRMRDGVRIYRRCLSAGSAQPGEQALPALLGWSPYGKHNTVGSARVARRGRGCRVDVRRTPRSKRRTRCTGARAATPSSIRIRAARGTPKASCATAAWARRRTVSISSQWIGAQRWSNGKVGMTGVSYLTAIQWQVAPLRPPHLAAINPFEGFSDWYREFAYHGGIPETSFLVRGTGNLQWSTTRTEDTLANALAHPLVRCVLGEQGMRSRSDRRAGVRRGELVGSGAAHARHARSVQAHAVEAEMAQKGRTRKEETNQANICIHMPLPSIMPYGRGQ